MTDMRKFINLVESANRIDEVVSTDTLAFRSWFGRSKVVDANGNPLPVYHGAARPERIGNHFKKSRATAGPMAYFTDDPAIASSYATGKADTSLNDVDADYSTWFKVKVPGYRNPVKIGQTWNMLSQEQKATMTDLAGRVRRFDDEGNETDDFNVGPEGKTGGPGGLEYTLKQHRGNAITALIDQWLNGAILFGEEEEFMKVLKLCKYPFPVIYDHPHATTPGVFCVFLCIQDPLDTSNIPANVVTTLQNNARRQRTKSNVSTTMWSKNDMQANAWISELEDDLKNHTTFAWTTVPDWVTKTLQSMGFDGIKDSGGKNGGDNHTVWIPFDEHQVKSAISNTNFDSRKKQIHK